MARIGRVTERIDHLADSELEDLGYTVKKALGKRFQGSFSIRHVDAGSCNACELEVQAAFNPYYDLERFGVKIVASPRHADALLVTGPVSRNMEAALQRTYDATPAPKIVIASGDCACTGGEFGESYASCGAVENVIPVDIKIPGCPPDPLELLHGVLAAIRKEPKKSRLR
ncbi:unnamed protein product [Cyprideis torosa]|uniref:Uncharacterized protein n=1 Tax=Cyprideis torosa TaxID=163714 RepID=A0A7R8ZXR4_9CRUS|nr:unnamed protein product [Cyprideis torosa]CAG0910599.1 unnamed protein product [Cyprideis torosa]